MSRNTKLALIATAIFLVAAYVVPAIIKVACWGFLGLFHLADKLALLF